MKRNDVTERRLSNRGTAVSIVKLTLNKFAKPEGRALDVDGCLFHINKCVLEAYLLANTHVVRTCQVGQPVPPLDQTFFYRCLSATSLGQVKRKAIDDDHFRASVDLYRSWRGETALANAAFLSSGWLQQASAQMATNTSNATAANFCRRFKRYLKSRYSIAKSDAYLVLRDILGEHYDGASDLVLRYHSLHVLPPVVVRITPNN